MKKVNLDTSLPKDLPTKTTNDADGKKIVTITAGYAQRIICKNFLEVYMKRVTVLDQNLRILYLLVWGQCSTSIRDQVKRTDNYQADLEVYNAIALIKTISEVTFNYQSKKYKHLALRKKVARALHFKQGRYMSVSTYIDRFQNNLDIVEHIRGTMWSTTGLINNMLQDNIGGIDPLEEELTEKQQPITRQRRSLQT